MDHDTEQTDGFGFACYRPTCSRVVQAPIDTATPIYCSPTCEAAADKEYVEAKERVEHLRDLLRRSQHWVAGFGRGDPGPTSGAEQVARDALAAAQGTLHGMRVTGGPNTDRERYLTQALVDLTTGVAALLDMEAS